MGEEISLRVWNRGNQASRASGSCEANEDPWNVVAQLPKLVRACTRCRYLPAVAGGRLYRSIVGCGDNLIGSEEATLGDTAAHHRDPGSMCVPVGGGGAYLRSLGLRREQGISAACRSHVDSDFRGLSDEYWQGILNGNLMSAVRLDRAFVPGRIERASGVVLHIGSDRATACPAWMLGRPPRRQGGARDV
jgi:hypothetical protein